MNPDGIGHCRPVGSKYNEFRNLLRGMSVRFSCRGRFFDYIPFSADLSILLPEGHDLSWRFRNRATAAVYLSPQQDQSAWSLEVYFLLPMVFLVKKERLELEGREKGKTGVRTPDLEFVFLTVWR